MNEFGNVLIVFALIYFVFKHSVRKTAKNNAAGHKPAQSAAPADKPRRKAPLAREGMVMQSKKPAGKPAQRSFAVPPPLPFDQAASPIPDSSEAAEASDPLWTRESEASEEVTAAAPARGAPSARPVPEAPQTKKTISPRPAFRVIPEFTQSALLQAVVAKEILARPRSAASRFRPGQRG